MRRFLSYWLPVIALCSAIFYQSASPPPIELDRIAFLDKLLHALVYGVLGALIYRALSTERSWRGRPGLVFWTSVSAAVLYGLSDEWHQSFVDARSAELADLVADAVGSVIGCAAYGKIIAVVRQRPGADTQRPGGARRG